MENDIPQLSEKELQKFGLILSGLLTLVFGMLLPYLWGLKLLPNYYWIVAGILVAIWALVAPSSMRGFYNAWMRVSMVIGHIVNTIILALVYFVVIVPMGLVMQMLGKDPMHRKWDKTINTYRKKSTVRQKNHFERPF
jgi:hypothetical protein